MINYMIVKDMDPYVNDVCYTYLTLLAKIYLCSLFIIYSKFMLIGS